MKELSEGYKCPLTVGCVVQTWQTELWGTTGPQVTSRNNDFRKTKNNFQLDLVV